MASYGRQLYIAVRASDQASRPMRRIARDVQALQGQRQRLARGTSQASLVAQRARSQAVGLAMERESIRNGQRYFAQQKAIERSQIALNNHDAKRLLQEEKVNKLAERNVDIQRVQAEQAALLEKRARAVKTMGEARYAERIGVAGSKPAMYEAEIARLATAHKTLLASALGTSTQLAREQAVLDKLTAEYHALELEMSRVVATGAAMDTKMAQITADMIRQSGAVALAEKRLAEYNLEMSLSKWNQVSRTLHDVSRSLGLVGVVGAASFGIMARKAVDFNTQLQLAATQSTTNSRRTAAQSVQNARFLQEQTNKFLASGNAVAKPEELASGLYTIFSGVTLASKTQNGQLREGMQLLKQFNDVAKANYGVVSFEEVTKAGVTIMNDFDVTARNMPKALNTMQAAVRYGAMTMGDFVGTFNNAAPAAKAAGYSFMDMSTALAFLSRRFPNVKVAAAGYARLTEILARPKFVESVRAQGVEVTNLRTGALLPLEEIITRLVKTYPKLAKGGQFLQNFFKETSGTSGTIQARRAFVFLNTGLSQFHYLASQIKGDRHELEMAVKAMQQSPGVRWEEFINQFKALVLMIGQEAIPAFITLGQPIGKLLHWFNSLDDSTKHWIATVGVFGSAVAIAAAMVLGMAGAVLRLFVIFKGWKIMQVIERDFVDAVIAGERFAGVTTTMTSEAGFARVAFIKWFGSIGLLLAALPLLHKAGMSIADMLYVVTTALTVLTARAAIKWAAGFLAEASAVRAALLLLATNPWTIVVTFAVVGELYLIRKINELQKMVDQAETRQVSEKVKDVLVPDLGDRITKLRAQGKTTAEIYQTLMRSLGAPQRTSDELDKVNYALENVAIEGTKAYRLLEKQSHQMTASLGVDATKALQAADIVAEAFKKLHESQTRQMTGIEEGRLTQNREVAARNARVSAFTGKRTDIMDQVPAFIAQINKFRRLSETTPNVKNILAYDNYLANLKEKLKDFPQLYDAIVQAAGAAFEKTAVISDREYLRRRSALERMHRALIKTHSKDFAAWKRYYDALTALDKVATDSQRQAGDEMFRKDEANQKKRTALAKRAAAQRAAFEQQALQTLQSKYEEFYNANKSAFGDLFSGPWLSGPRFQNMVQFGMHDRFGRATPRPSDLLKDARGQANRFGRFTGSLNDLVSRGLPQELVNQIRAQGPESQPNIDALQRMTKKQLAEYSRLWARGQAQILAATKLDFEPEIKKWRIHGKEIAKAIQQGMSEESFAIFQTLRRQILADLRSTKLPGHEAPKITVDTRLTPNSTSHVDNSTHLTIPHTVSGHFDMTTQMKHALFEMRNKK